MHRAVALLLVFATAAGACGSDDPPAESAPKLTTGESQVCHTVETLAALDRTYAELVLELSPEEVARMTRHIRRTEHRLATELAKRADNETVSKSIRDLAHASAEYRRGRTAWALDDKATSTPRSEGAQPQPVAPVDQEAAAQRNRLHQRCLDAAPRLDTTLETLQRRDN